MNIILIFSSALIIIAFITFYGLWVGKGNIFPGSGKPITMAKVILSSILVNSQIIFGLFICTSLLILIQEEKIEANSGLPLLSAISGYLLGKTFKDITNSSTENKENKN
jgi:hypothetical protein